MFSYVLKKWYIVFLCSVLCSGALFYEKSSIQPPILKGGKVTLTRSFKVNPIPKVSNEETFVEMNLVPIVGMWGNLNVFLDTLESNFDCTVFNPKWHSLQTRDKFAWIVSHFRVAHIAPGMYETVISFEPMESQRTNYILENENALTNAYSNYVVMIANDLSENAVASDMKDYFVVDQVEPVTPERMDEKYAIIGFVLGMVSGTLGLMVVSLRKQRDN